MLKRKSWMGVKILSFIRAYLGRIKAFNPNARKYLAGIMIFGAAMGVYQLLFNFYVLSLGYNEALLGSLVAARSATSLIVALPMGYAADMLGRKNSFILGNAGVGVGIALMVFFPSIPMFMLMSVFIGIAQSLSSVAMGPFLMENSREKERTYLFSFSSGLRMTAASIGEWLGGYLPTWIALQLHVSATSSAAYARSLAVIAIGVGLSLIPNMLISRSRLPESERSVFAPFAYMRKNPGGLGKLILPLLLTSIGAGMIMPFMNVFFRQVHHLSDAAIGILFAWGSLAMGIGLLLAPALAEHFGKIRIVVATQGLSIPFLVVLGFSPVFWLAAVGYYIRLVLMNMSSPVYSTFVMEKVEPDSRAMVASLSSMAQNFGWAFSPSISGYFQVQYGFGPSFFTTIVFYLISIWMYYSWFWRKRIIKNAAAAQS